ncbi:hypothetical protein ACFWPH_04950 [Nocardia sp. NPDC058499]|uniref:phosphotransferase-like protein n=1 Tax=Nocardia sp. NPDC058499 TaxID=3346530 RepID=UPI0036697FD0
MCPRETRTAGRYPGQYTGTSSSGKTTRARAVPDESDTPFVYWGIDTLFGLVPSSWGGGSDSPLSRDTSGHRIGQRTWSNSLAVCLSNCPQRPSVSCDYQISAHTGRLGISNSA